MTDTYGPTGATSSPSSSLQLSLANRLQARLAGNGSPLYALKWKQWDMPSGPPICALRASAPRISARGFSLERRGWMTPISQDAKHSGHAVSGPGKSNKLAYETVKLSGWPTVRMTDGGKNVRTPAGVASEIARKGSPQDLLQAVTLSGWPTAARDHKDTFTAAGRGQLPEAVARSGWPTPMAGNPGVPGRYNPAGNTDSSRKTVALLKGMTALRVTTRGGVQISSTAVMESSARLNPAHSRWLMGYPAAWCDCAGMATPSSRSSRRNSS